MLQAAVQAVADFHKAKNIDFRQDITQLAPRSDMPQLRVIMRQHAEQALHVYETLGDLRMLRLHLILEECEELVGAILDSNEELILDAMGDLIYVIIGAAVTCDLPLAEAFTEIHRSNMTKAPKSKNGPGANRLRVKGTSYSPPDLKAVLRAHRTKKRQPTKRKGKRK